jgi:hypothetical protein
MTVMEMFQGLRTHFKLPQPNRYLCPTALIQKKGVLDIIKFDDWLHTQHGQYEDKGMSMKECIRKEYGENAVSFVEKCL